MLQTLSIKNVALISNLTIDFNDGFNVLLGETGAGKSIIFDALNFVLGGKAEKTLIRYGESEMRVDAVFSGISESNRTILAELGFDEDELCLSRVLNCEGKTTVRINGFPSSQSLLKQVGSVLVDSYSQHESVDLLKSKNHLALLDKFGGESVEVLKGDVKRCYNACQDIARKIEDLGGDQFERERMKSLLEYQIKEIEDAQLNEGEDEDISNRLKFLNGAEKIYQSLMDFDALMNDSPSACIKSLQQASSILASLPSFDEIEECRNRLDSVRYELEDINETLLSIKDSTDYDEREFDRLDRRNDLIKSLTKKYGGSIKEILQYLVESKEKLDDLMDSEYLLEKYEKEKKDAYECLRIACDKLSSCRKEVASNIEQSIVKELADLGMKSSRFQVNFEKLESSTINGNDKVEFEFSANKGQEVKSLAKTASGGELSRFMLAVKNIFAKIGGAQTLVFDEIDAGISGETGNIVGEKLNNITQYAQILCITHLPQVACYADSLYFVSKSDVGNKTETSINVLDGDSVYENLARMFAGDNVSETALKQAYEMRNKAKAKI